jgi:hypothetical protein
MEAVMAVSETVPARGVQTAVRKRVRIDWKRGAALLIDGETPRAVCAALGIDEDRLWHHLRSSLRFQYLLRQARERRQLLGSIRFEAASRDAVLRLARSAEKPDAALVAELAGTGHGADGAQDERRDVIARLSESGRRPPNQAFRRRLAAERRRMDAEFADHCRAVDAHRAAQAAAGQTADNAAQPETKTQVSENKSQVSGNKTHISGNKTQISANSGDLGTAKAGPDAARPTPERDRPARTAAAPASRLPPGLQSGGIVDLTDLHGNPLPGVQRQWDSGSAPRSGRDDERDGAPAAPSPRA